jgi:hypothetical protein
MSFIVNMGAPWSTLKERANRTAFSAAVGVLGDCDDPGDAFSRILTCQ